MKVLDGNALFVKLYYIPGLINENSPSILSSMPGIRKGISGTILVGYNIGIISNIDEYKIEPAIEVIKYMTSKKIQTELVLKEIIISGITSLYEEDDICSKIKYCDFYKFPQTIIKPPNVLNLNNYYEKFTNYFFDFLFKNETATNALKKMENLTKIYNDDSNLFENFSLSSTQKTELSITNNSSSNPKFSTKKSFNSNSILTKMLDYHKKDFTLSQSSSNIIVVSNS
ncbi:hypothetical protein PIROE2DRAFT_16315 [Piromyces sp. E2]|nr:hypothetical protein PIROE2DRAFT_16315 [Piromyces sp. E2]|eukprot:OUM58406.1 hypothetical protein PIROE2DRAFT_16315 [Piromyces sp. E2]